MYVLEWKQHIALCLNITHATSQVQIVARYCILTPVIPCKSYYMNDEHKNLHQLFSPIKYANIENQQQQQHQMKQSREFMCNALSLVILIVVERSNWNVLKIQIIKFYGWHLT